MNQRVNFILNQFPPLKRKSLLKWLQTSTMRRRAHHQAFLNVMADSDNRYPFQVLDLKTKIAFSVMHEFGHSLSGPAIATTIDAVETRLRNKTVCLREPQKQMLTLIRPVVTKH